MIKFLHLKKGKSYFFDIWEGYVIPAEFFNEINLIIFKSNLLVDLDVEYIFIPTSWDHFSSYQLIGRDNKFQFIVHVPELILEKHYTSYSDFKETDFDRIEQEVIQSDCLTTVFSLISVRIIHLNFRC